MRTGSGTLALTAASVEALNNPAEQTVPESLIWIGAGIVAAVTLAIVP